MNSSSISPIPNGGPKSSHADIEKMVYEFHSVLVQSDTNFRLLMKHMEEEETIPEKLLERMTKFREETEFVVKTLMHMVVAENKKVKDLCLNICNFEQMKDYSFFSVDFDKFKISCILQDNLVPKEQKDLFRNSLETFQKLSKQLP